MTTDYIIGTSGWQYEGWQGIFYPPKLAEGLETVYIYFNNDVQGFALDNAKILRTYLHAE